MPLRAQVESRGYGRAQGTVVMEGVPLSVHVEVDSPGRRQMLWYDRRLVLEMPPDERLDLEMRARARALGFGRTTVFDSLFPPT